MIIGSVKQLYTNTTLAVSMGISVEDDTTADTALSVPPLPYFTKRLSMENTFLAEFGKYTIFKKK